MSNVNEVGRTIIGLGPNPFTFLSSSFLVLLKEEIDGKTPTTTLFTSQPKGDWEVMSSVCRSYAPQTVRGKRIVDGKKITPEKYLKLWEDALKDAVPIDQFLRTGKQIRAQVTLFDGFAQAKTCWTDAIYKTGQEALDALKLPAETAGFELILASNLQWQQLYAVTSMSAKKGQETVYAEKVIKIVDAPNGQRPAGAQLDLMAMEA